MAVDLPTHVSASVCVDSGAVNLQQSRNDSANFSCLASLATQLILDEVVLREC